MSFLNKLFGKGAWDSVSGDITKLLWQTLGVESFDNFTKLCYKYNLFDKITQIATIDAGGGRTRTIEDRIGNLALLLANVGHELGRQSVQHGSKLIKDGIEFLKIAITLMPDLGPARADLAFFYYRTAFIIEAKEEAKQAIKILDKEVGNPPPPWMKELLPSSSDEEWDEERRELRAFLQKIVEDCSRIYGV